MSLLISVVITIVSFLIFSTVAYIIQFYIQVFNRRRNGFPPGPLPLPWVGNAFLLLRLQKPAHEFFTELSKKYGPAFTFYMGPYPRIIVVDKDLSLSVLRNDAFAGRPYVPLKSVYWPDGMSTDITFGDYTTEWQLLRKAAHSALRKYAVGDKLPILVSQVVDSVVKKWKSLAEKGQPIDASLWMFRTFYSILAESAFGRPFAVDDSAIDGLIRLQDVQQTYGNKLIMYDFLPWLRYIFPYHYKLFTESSSFQWEFEEKEFERHIKTFDSVNVRDFTDALLMVNEEGDRDTYVKPANIMNVVRDLINAGSETSHATMLWAFLFMSTYPEYQKRMRQEIEEIIGDKELPTLEHKAKCHLTVAFISETMRMRSVVPSNLPHKALYDVELCGNVIPKGTGVIPLLTTGLLDKESWGDPDVFRPERFLTEDGTHTAKPNAYFNPFAAGRRSCPGEKVALADIFFALARFLQQTKGYEFSVRGGPGSVPLTGDPSHIGGFLEFFVWVPHNYELVLKKAGA